jgi:hypothetical protein
MSDSMMDRLVDGRKVYNADGVQANGKRYTEGDRHESAPSSTDLVSIYASIRGIVKAYLKSLS